jgi:hypothetical protein
MYSLRFHSPTNAHPKIDKARELGFRAIEGGVPGSRVYFIEDEAKNSVEQIPQSFRYLKSLKF